MSVLPGKKQTEEDILKQEAEAAAELEKQRQAEQEAEQVEFKKPVEQHLSEAEEFIQPIQITRTKIIDDKYVIDRRDRKLIIEYRIGNIDEDGDLVDVQEETIVYRDEDFDAKINELFTENKLFFAKGRTIAKNHLKTKFNIKKEI